MSTTATTSTATGGSGVRPFGRKDKLGYLTGDLGNDFMFIFASAYLMVFYTDVAGLNAGHVGTLFLVVRFVDAFTDIGWGRFLDRHRPRPAGRFRTWIGRMALPVGVASALLYMPFIADWAYAAKFSYAALTYLLWGSVFYTMVNISYGSMVSVVSDDPGERSALSVFRGAGASVAGLIVSLLPPLLIYGTIDGSSQVIPTNLVFVAIGFSACAVVMHRFCFRWTLERVPAPPQREQRGLMRSLGALLGNRALLSLISANLILMLGALLTSALAPYLWLEYFNDGQLSGPAQVVNYLPALLLAPIATALAVRLGKKEVLCVALLVTSAVYFWVYFAGITDPWVFIGLTLLAGFGVGAFNLLVWAMITDVIDDGEVRTGQRDAGTVYAINTWARKVGQAIAGGLGGYALAIVGYQSGTEDQSQATVDGIYAVATLVPGIIYLLVVLMLLVWYPLSRRTVLENGSVLARRRSERQE
ncbi:MFS transporter [Nesterenkonia halophila]|uniref:MFS transporter n=1 Tax=Nesterenkonia halophila TaxID=302044 RepID=UPI0012925F75|nr:glycoside-pentoside-hexuronide (GPH):cation symporter [Nesterenkonia halophila]